MSLYPSLFLGKLPATPCCARHLVFHDRSSHSWWSQYGLVDWERVVQSAPSDLHQGWAVCPGLMAYLQKTSVSTLKSLRITAWKSCEVKMGQVTWNWYIVPSIFMFSIFLPEKLLLRLARLVFITVMELEGNLTANYPSLRTHHFGPRKVPLRVSASSSHTCNPH